MPPLALKCIDSWKKHLAEYEFVLWNEDTFDINSNLYVMQAYENRKFAFVTDYVRLHALYYEGGVYMDTDVEVLKPFDKFLVHPAFSGFESADNVPTGMMAAEKTSKWIRDLLAYYDDKPFLNEDGSFNMTTNTTVITNYMLTKGLKLNNQYQEFKDLVVFYPNEYFCPKDHTTGVIKITDNSYCIHHFAMSWISPKKVRLSNLKKKLMAIFGVKLISSVIDFFHLDKLKAKIVK